MKYITENDIISQLSNLKQLTFEITDACNLNCTYCGYGEFYNDYDKREHKTLPINHAKKLIDYLTQLWQSEYNTSSQKNIYISFYGGEPLLNMKFVKEIVEYISTIRCSTRFFTFSMTTNAILLHKHIDYLTEKNFNLLISLDGDAHNTSYRVDKHNKPAFEKIIENINLTKEKYPIFFEKNVEFNAVLHNRNSVSEIYSFFKNNYNKIPSIGELNDMGIRPDKKQLFLETYRKANESLKQAENYSSIEKDMFMHTANYQSAFIYLHKHTNFVYQDYNELIYGKDYKRVIPTGTCLPFGKKMFITVNGKILPCERIGHQFALGHLNKDGIYLELEAIAERYNNYFTKLENQCSHCYHKQTCTQCIFNLENLEDKPICHGFMNKRMFDNYQTNQLNFLQNNPEEYYRIMEEVILE